MPNFSQIPILMVTYKNYQWVIIANTAKKFYFEQNGCFCLIDNRFYLIVAYNELVSNEHIKHKCQFCCLHSH